MGYQDPLSPGRLTTVTTDGAFFEFIGSKALLADNMRFFDPCYFSLLSDKYDIMKPAEALIDNKTQKQRSIGIDVLRVLCILYIVGFWHLFNYTDAFPSYKNSVTKIITLIVLATFVYISGYLVGIKNISMSKKELPRFYKKRFFRIYPLYFFSLVVFYLFQLSDLTTIIKGALAVSMFIKPAPPTLWYISMLLVFYAITPLLIILSQKQCIINIILIYFGLTFILGVYHYLTKHLDVRVLSYLPAFFLGLSMSIKGKNYFNKKILSILFAISATAYFSLNQKISGLNWVLSTMMVSIAPFFLFTLFNKNIRFPEKTIKPIAILSTSSYCMYLFHRPIFLVMKDIYFPASETLQVVYLVAICLPFIILISYVIQYSYNTMVLSLTKSRQPRPRSGPL